MTTQGIPIRSTAVADSATSGSALGKPLMESLRDDYLEARRVMDEEVPRLIAAGKEMTALLTLTHASAKVFAIRESLSTFYSLILTNVSVLSKNGSSRLAQLGHKPLPTWEFLKESESDREDYETYRMALGAFEREGLLKKHWHLPELVVTELEYMLDVLQIMVEPEFVPFDDEDESTPSREVGDETTRHIPAGVKLAVWRRDLGKCTSCGSRDRLEYDHIIPVAKGGSNTERNVQLLCEKCNREKAARIA